ncbi:hypothetical protein DAPPUDRAFT_249772 [Daphnia pulex]|uniref:Uncharacterized protein n=1 Tax=Daphnia pulex TaxID=6669 RepID=E9GXA2_DAPPU|nr:hypothetical protein DAPPUDRAFT_249772 [Daphnia pulex]|eukprot:EFX75896.1 hypothetical protein DAPPUDRAFT_249772 [Daphnia pulex]
MVKWRFNSVDYDRVTEPLQIPKLWTQFHGDVDVDSTFIADVHHTRWSLFGKGDVVMKAPPGESSITNAWKFIT